jgi:hypothetical protein
MAKRTYFVSGNFQNVDQAIAAFYAARDAAWQASHAAWLAGRTAAGLPPLCPDPHGTDYCDLCAPQGDQGDQGDQNGGMA